MPDPDYRALCAELVDIVTAHCNPDDFAVGYCAAVLTRARAALAQPDPISKLVSQCRPLEPEMAEYLTPQARWRLYGDEAQPEPAPTDEELLRLAREWNSGHESIEFEFIGDYARAVLARWGNA